MTILLFLMKHYTNKTDIIRYYLLLNSSRLKFWNQKYKYIYQSKNKHNFSIYIYIFI